jgi:hypothetical protein
LSLAVEQIKHSHAFIYSYLTFANTESELAFASDFAIPVALAELSDRLITDFYFVVLELSVIEWFYLACLDLLMFSSVTEVMFDLGLSIDSTHTEPSAPGSALDLEFFLSMSSLLHST